MATRLKPANDPAPAPAPADVLPALRFIACGSVDDGKSTLLGRLLHDARALFTDQMETLAADSRRFGTTGAAPDFALLLDGLDAEREQGITIDVAYRYFATPRRRFIVADTPGHEQYTRNMVTGASTADAAVVLVDARTGLLPQTRRHSAVLQLLGVPTVVLAVNKMDLVGHDEGVFRAIAAEYRALAARLGLPEPIAVPVAARHGDNVFARSAAMAWHEGPTLIDALEAAPALDWRADRPFAMPVQLVSRPDAGFRGHAGRIAAGRVRPGDRLRVLPAGTEAVVARIVTPGGDRREATAGDSVMLTLAGPVDCARGDVLVAPDSAVRVATEVQATLAWLDREPLAPERRYLAKLGTRTVVARVSEIASVFDPDTGDHRRPVGPIGLNDIAAARLHWDRPVALNLYRRSRVLGAFILIDPVSHATVAAGMVREIVAGSDGRDRHGATIRWIDAPAAERDALAARAATLLRARGHAVRIVDAAAIAELRALAPAAARLELANAAARLLRDAGTDVVLAFGGEAGLTPAGDPLTSAEIDRPDPDWVI
ncbi:sulfate adenylyltransferase subunit 1 [uncultured Sphingomonas sp.]|uniref:sulfate adenylyltransferase subunit 1 n=1 Tax=uncultured Sphingomonas sp. TaxID=158754 RepID=UPI0035CB4D24